MTNDTPAQPSHPLATRPEPTATHWQRLLSLPGLLVFLITPLCAQSPNYTPPPAAIESFLVEHCFDCHDDDVQKGDLDLTALPFDLSNHDHFARWERVLDRVLLDEMPPKKRERPNPTDVRKFLFALKQPLAAADRADIETNGRVHGRRLTRREYEFAIQDLLGVAIPLDEVLTADPTTHGFETIADGQQLSLHVLARQLDAADLVLKEAFARALEGDVNFSRKYFPKDLTKTTKSNYRGPELRGSQAIYYNIGNQFYGRMPETNVPESGWYDVTLKSIKSINPVNGQNGVLYALLQSGKNYSDDPLLHDIDIIEATPKPRDLTFRAYIREGHTLRLKPADATLKRVDNGAKNGGDVSYKGRDLVKAKTPAIGITGINLKRVYPGGERDVVLHGLFADITTPAGFKAANKKPKAEKEALLSKLIIRFAHRAFRAPVPFDTVKPYLDLAFTTLAEKGTTMTDAYKAATRALLCSPRFLTRIESPGALDANAVALRLSLALWNSTPDWPLRKDALDGRLLQSDVLAGHVERLLKHQRAERFIESFTDQWLTLNAFDETSPDKRMFYPWDAVTRASVLEEPRVFIRHLIEKDLPATHLVDTDYVFHNHRLARHYKTATKTQASPGGGFQKLQLAGSGGGGVRGGLVTQAAILKLTANGTTTSPVVRGVWVGERILGDHIPPPPPNIPAVEPDIRGATSIRDQLEKHRASEACASCHARIDPPGFALENFNPVGLWRSAYGKNNKGKKVDPSGVTPEGQPFEGIISWKAIHAKQSDRLAKAFATHFLTYATGAPPRFADRDTLAVIVKKTRDKKHGLRSIIHAAVASDIFLRK